MALGPSARARPRGDVYVYTPGTGMNKAAPRLLDKRIFVFLRGLMAMPLWVFEEAGGALRMLERACGLYTAARGRGAVCFICPARACIGDFSRVFNECPGFLPIVAVFS